MYLIQPRYMREKSRHYLNLYLCYCNTIYIKRKPIKCNICTKVDINFNIMSCYKRLYERYNLSAWKRQLSFNITLAEFIVLVNGNCSYCGSEKSNSQNYGKYILKYNGIDRADNSIGYQLENCVSCCKQCNYSKHTMNSREFLSWATKVVRNVSKDS